MKRQSTPVVKPILTLHKPKLAGRSTTQKTYTPSGHSKRTPSKTIRCPPRTPGDLTQNISPIAKRKSNN
jgi:hypothetical protein